MMTSAHFFLVHLPNWAGFAVLIGVWVLFRGFLLRTRRSALERMRMGRASVPAATNQVAYSQIRCPRCSAMAPGVAMYCPHCGLSFSSVPPAIPVAMVSQRRNGLQMLIWILLGLIGLAAYVYWRSDTYERPEIVPEPSGQTQHHYHYP